jgi:hypothetical protein
MVFFMQRQSISKLAVFVSLAMTDAVSEAMPLTSGGGRSNASCSTTAPLIGGMAAPFVADHSITSSAIYGNSATYGMNQMWRSRLDSDGEHGVALNPNKQQWIQWDLLKTKTITKIAIRGGSSNAWWIKTFKLKISDDGSNWRSYEDDKILYANIDKDSVKDVALSPLQARYIRLYPETWNGMPQVKLELFGCPSNHLPATVTPCAVDVSLVGKRDRKRITDAKITASSYHGNNPTWGKDQMWRSRLDGTNGWMGGVHQPGKSWIQWEFDSPRVIDGIRTL